VSLRVKDIDFGNGQVLVRRGKGHKDRSTRLPHALVDPLREHLVRVRERYDADLKAGGARVELPGALSTKYPNAPQEWAWHWVFLATRRYVDRVTGEERRHHIHETALAARRAGRRGRRGYRHHDVRTTMVYTHVLNRGPWGVKSPLDP
jgi:integrase